MIPPWALPRHPAVLNKLQVKPAQSRNVILLATRSCHIFLTWPNRNCPPEQSASASSINPHTRPARTVYWSAQYQFPDLQDFRQDYSQPLQNLCPWVGSNLKSLLRQSSDRSARDQCYCCHSTFISSKVSKTESTRLTRTPGLALTGTLWLILVGTMNRDLLFYLIWSMPVSLLVTRIVLPIQYSTITIT